MLNKDLQYKSATPTKLKNAIPLVNKIKASSNIATGFYTFLIIYY